MKHERDDLDTLNIYRVSWVDGKEQLEPIRRQVFIEEQQVPEGMEWDGYDETSIHYIAMIGEELVACARFKPDGQLGRIAVVKNRRRQGIGHQLVDHILEDVAAADIGTIYLHAQVDAIPFYEKLGFVCRGEQFEEAGIQHREMVLASR